MDKQAAILATEAQMQAKAAPAAEAAPKDEPAPVAPEADKPEAIAPKAETPAAAVDDSDEDTEVSATSGDGDETTAAPRKPRKQNRFDQLTREKYEGIRRAEAAESRLAALEQQIQGRQPSQTQQNAPTQPQGRPTLEQFGYDQDAYETARDAWVIGQAEQSWTQKHQQAETQRQQQERLGKFEQRIAKFQAEVPGAWEAVLASPVQPTQTMREAVADSDVGPQMAHYLTQNLDEAFAITQLAPIRQAVAMGRIEAKLLQAPPAPSPKPQTTVTRAPAPAPVIASGSTGTSRMESMEDHEAAVRAQRLKRLQG